MILTAEEYSRGFIDFDAVLPDDCTVELWTRTADQPGDNTEWTGPYSNPDGAKVLSPLKPYLQLRVGLNRGEDPSEAPVLNKVRWERDAKTFIWPGPSGFVGPPGPLSLGRDYGVSYRLVFQPQRAGWSEPFVLIGQEARIRFWKGPLKGHKISGFHGAELTSESTLSVEGSIEEFEAEGDLVEVLVTISGNTDEQRKEEAKNRVESVVGLLALCFGEQILGKPIFAEYYFSIPTGEQGDIKVPVKHLFEISIESNLASSVENPLEKLFNSELSNSIAIALRWYAAALNADSPVDMYIAYFIGLEALASGYFASIRPRPPVREEYTKLKEYFLESQPPIDHRLRDVTLSRIKDFPLSTKFDKYWESLIGHETRQSREFSRLNRLRSELLHGRLRSVTSIQVSSVKNLLEKSLVKELGLNDALISQLSGPRLLEFVLSYATAPSNDSIQQ